MSCPPKLTNKKRPVVGFNTRRISEIPSVHVENDSVDVKRESNVPIDTKHINPLNKPINRTMN